jgi:hypothetical protein
LEVEARKPPVTVDNFALQQFRTCPVMGYYRITKGLVLPSAPRTALTFGVAIHAALEALYLGSTTEGAIARFEEEFSEYEREEDSLRTCATGKVLLQHYVLYDGRRPFEVLDVEKPFKLPLVVDANGRPEIEYCGRLDLVVRWNSTGRLMVVEHKTTTRMGLFISDPNNQGMGYVWGAQLLYPAEKVDGIVWNFLGVYHPYPKSGKSKYQIGEGFKRVPTYYETKRLIDWRLRIVALIEDISRWHERGIFWDNTNACGAYSSECQYVPLCRAETTTEREDLVRELYEVSPWSPGAEIISVE